MLAVLSPAKRLHEGPRVADLPATRPDLLDDAAHLADRARALGAGGLARVMGISDALAAQNADRFARWAPEPADGRQAARLFAGDTYVGLDAATLSADDLAWAQDRVAILSGLYGALRPLDVIAPYRLEMGTRFDTGRGGDLYAFWGDRVARALAARLADHDHRVVINLASSEYVGAIDRDALGVPVIDLVFQDVKGGKARTLGFFAKQARGAMARAMIQHRATDPAQLKALSPLGYTFEPALSEDHRWVFRRPQPPPAR